MSYGVTAFHISDDILGGRPDGMMLSGATEVFSASALISGCPSTDRVLFFHLFVIDIFKVISIE